MTSSLLGVVLICYSSRGHQLVFSYPTEPKRSSAPSQSKHQRSHLSRTLPNVRSEKQGLTEPRGRDFARTQQPAYVSHSGQSRGRPPSAHLQTEKFLGFDTHFLSDILSPKVALCDRQFQLTVDDVTFVGHPTLLHADRPGTGHRFARLIQRKRLYASMKHGRSSSATNLLDPDVLGLAPPSLDKSAYDSSLDVDIAASSPRGSSSTHQLSMFNLVFAMQPDGGQKDVDSMYTHVISKITAALKYEQLKRGYIRKEAELIISIKDDAQLKSTGGKMASGTVFYSISNCGPH